MKKHLTFWVILAGLVSGGICLLACTALFIIGTGAYNVLSLGNPVTVGSTAPDFELTTLSGNVIRLSQFRGQPVVVNIGASWCPDCRKAAPILQDLHERHPELVVLSVDSREPVETVQAFADEHGLTFVIALDSDGQVLKSYRVRAIPTLFFVDGEGVIQAHVVEVLSEEQLEQALVAIGITP